MKLLIFDTETTDLWKNTLVQIDKQPEIFDWYGLTLDTDSMIVIDELQVFAKPEGKIAEGASKATKKNDSDFLDYEPFAKNAKRIKDYIERHDAVLGHNVIFDYGVTNFEMQRCGLMINWPPLIDSVEKSEWVHGYRLTLTALYDHLFGEKFKEAHTAKADVMALKNCWIEMIQRGWV